MLKINLEEPSLLGLRMKFSTIKVFGINSMQRNSTTTMTPNPIRLDGLNSAEVKVQTATGILMSLHARMLIGLNKLHDEAPNHKSWKE